MTTGSVTLFFRLISYDFREENQLHIDRGLQEARLSDTSKFNLMIF
jgi:hypothetical protein